MKAQPRYRTLREVYDAHQAGDIERPRISRGTRGDFAIYGVDADAAGMSVYLWHGADSKDLTAQALSALAIDLESA